MVLLRLPAGEAAAGQRASSALVPLHLLRHRLHRHRLLLCRTSGSVLSEWPSRPWLLRRPLRQQHSAAAFPAPVYGGGLQQRMLEMLTATLTALQTTIMMTATMTARNLGRTGLSLPALVQGQARTMSLPTRPLQLPPARPHSAARAAVLHCLPAVQRPGRAPARAPRPQRRLGRAWVSAAAACATAAATLRVRVQAPASRLAWPSQWRPRQVCLLAASVTPWAMCDLRLALQAAMEAAAPRRLWLAQALAVTGEALAPR